MIFSTCLPLTANQNPLKAAFSPHLLVVGLKLFSALRQIRQALQKEQDQSPASLGGVTTYSSMPPPALPALQGFPSTEQKKDLLPITVPFLPLYVVFVPNTTPLPVTHPSVSRGLFSYLQRGSWFGNTDTFKKYSSSIQSALTLLLTQKTKAYPPKLMD